MNSREIEQLKKKSIYSTQLNNHLKEQIVYSEINELSKFLKIHTKNKKLIVFVMQEDSKH